MRRYDRRDVLKGAAAIGVAAPVLWRQPEAGVAAAAIGPRWIAFGPTPPTSMYVSWATGSATGKRVAPAAPRVRWGLKPSHQQVVAADASGPVPLLTPAKGQPAENTVYNHVLLTGLSAGTTYHYSVSNDGINWSPDATFRTAVAGTSGFRFTAFGDQARYARSTTPMVELVASLAPAFHLVAGDLAYATPRGLRYPDFKNFHPARWDTYLGIIGPHAAKSIPWMASVGAHEVEPTGSHGYAGFTTRFIQNYDQSSGSPVVHSFRYGNVAFIHLDGNDLSAQETINNGYTKGAQTAWLARKLADFRAAGTGIDFIVVVCDCSCYSTNRTHGSDGGLREVWGPLFDRYHVDLVISGHVHAYERTNPIRAGQPTKKVASGGTVHPPTDGTTYICAGGGGNGLYRTWYGTTDAGDSGSATRPKVWTWSGGNGATGGRGHSEQVTDTAEGFSAFRRAAFSVLSIDVTAPSAKSGQTTMHIRALAPVQTSNAVKRITNPDVMDSVSLVRST